VAGRCLRSEASFPDREADRTEGLPSASQTVWRAAEKVEELKRAIADEETPNPSV
jgi:hypothetical protein